MKKDNVLLLDIKRKLREFQKKGVLFIEEKKGRCLLADEMGLGKTIQSLAWLSCHPELRPAVIICPASVKYNWDREARTTLYNCHSTVLSSGKVKKIKGKIVIVNYDVAGKWKDKILSIAPKVMILDECHYLKNKKAKRTKHIKAMSKKMKCVIALSGSPIVNRPADIFSVLNMLQPKTFSSFWNFGVEYCDATHNDYGWDFSGASNTKKLHKLLTSTVMLRRLKKDVLKELPMKIRTTIPIEISNAQEYRRAEDDFIAWLQEKAPGSLEGALKAEAVVKIEKLKQICIEGKKLEIGNWIEDTLEDTDKLVIFATHKDTVEWLCSLPVLKRMGKRCVKIDGSVSAVGREEAVRSFQNDKDVALFVGNIRASGVGITLTASSNVVFAELGWTPAEHIQAEDRCHRMGQKDSVNAWYLLSKKTIETKIMKLLNKKWETISGIMDGTEGAESDLINEITKSYRKGER